ncbi:MULTISPECIES: BRO family protein [unclassified Gilliamella]|uniref:BRO family protein n=1 Tax=unclassified Gilliamella TaxID=2685620 RepID=UPI001305F5D2|nr:MULTISPECIES: BRO family protein [unclassified Gilliamella]MWP48550.1 hypothetical protein [Gilliamella sp. Lep-s35]MWP68612.1 hypothetical protein [Gilliamella sp. Lep-s5]MWP76720.1 hypothetical protein [Gilliamella sp. Lep-s21]
MSNISINFFTFNFNNSPVRTTEINNQLWFLANDVCSILEYKNPRRAIELHCKEKGVTKRYTLTKGGNQEMTYISEANLFRLIIKSKQEKAVIFEEWVMEDLLPTIRKTGSYSLTINAQQQQQIKQAVNERAYRTGEHYQAIYTKLYEQFKIPRYQDLPLNQFDNAIEFLGGLLIKPEALTGDELCDFAWLYKAAEHMRREIEEIEPALRVLKSEKASLYYTMSREYRNLTQLCKKIVQSKMKSTQINKNDLSWQRVLPYFQ